MNLQTKQKVFFIATTATTTSSSITVLLPPQPTTATNFDTTAIIRELYQTNGFR